MTDLPPNTEIKIRGRTINLDSSGLVSLNDIWRAAGYTKKQRPADWLSLSISKHIIIAVLQRVTGKSSHWDKREWRSVITYKSGQEHADVRIALAYAEFLNPKLAVEVREVFLRYKAADPALADDILERSSAENNERIGIRALGRGTRIKYTTTLHTHGVAKGLAFANCTNGIYRGLFGKTASGIRADKNLPKKANLRDHMDTDELTYVMASESLASERIKEENCWGQKECYDASKRSASFIQEAIEKDRADRQVRRLDLQHPKEE